MSNLIITIISIAIIAVAAIMGIYYGGVAYENGQAQAVANSIANKAKQINAAIVLYQAQTGTGFLTVLQNQVASSCGWTPVSTYGYGTSACIYGNVRNVLKTLLVPTYISDVTSGDTSSGSQQDFNGTGPSYQPHLNWTGYDSQDGTPVNAWEVSGSDGTYYLRSGAYNTYGYFMWILDGDGTMQQNGYNVTSMGVKVCNNIAIMARGNNAVPIHMTNVPYTSTMNPVLDCGWTTAASETTISQCIGNNDCTLFISAQLQGATF